MNMNQEQLKKLRLIQIELLDEFARICEVNNFTYFLTAGTLLGAVRHKGFIPWDDDIDVAMPRKDYELFINYYENIQNTSFYIVTNKCPVNTYYHYNTFVKFCKKGTIYAEKTRNKEDYCGIFIDIWPYDNCVLFFLPLHSFLIKAGFRLYRLKTYDSESKINKVNPKIKKTVKYLVPAFICKIFYRFSVKLCYLFNRHMTKYISFLTGNYNYKRETHKYNDIYPLTPVLFENNFYNAPKNTHLFLKIMYGNYMELPPVEKQKTHGDYYTITID